MCGICGIVRADRLHPTDTAAVRQMTAAMTHRGPDADGFLWDRHVGLGMRRLRIIDLVTGDQPIFNEDRTVAIVFNGEVYNYRRLVGELQQRGHRFRTHSDTEAVVHAYEEWGDSCVQRLRGMFAFAIYDSRPGHAGASGSARVMLARDRLGIKPLYYCQIDGAILFASEVRALLSSGLVPRRLGLPGLRSYLAYGSVQDPLTLVDGVSSLLPGHVMVIDVHDGTLTARVQQYWHLPGHDAVRDDQLPRVTDRLRDLLVEAVGMRLIADVPLGVFLSGGIDSTAVAALMKEAAAESVKAFSVVFDEPTFDERRFSRLAAHHIGAQHTELHLTGADVRRELPRALAAFDQPSLDGLNTYFISKVTREAGLTVALSGMGGDELFGGYEGYRKTLLVDRWARRLRMLPDVARPAARGVLGLVSANEYARWAADALEDGGDPYFLSRRMLTTAQVRQLLQPEALEASAGWEPARFHQLVRETNGYDPINRTSALELQTYLLSTLLRDTDQMSMAHSLEVRVPLLDHLLVEFLFGLPGEVKIDPHHPKPLLTAALDGAIPPECIHRSKMGFVLPFQVWLRQALETQMESAFADASSPDGVFRRGALQSLWNDFQHARVSWSRAWAMFVLQDWLRRWELRL